MCFNNYTFHIANLILLQIILQRCIAVLSVFCIVHSSSCFYEHVQFLLMKRSPTWWYCNTLACGWCFFFFGGVGRYTVDLCHPDCFKLTKIWLFPALQLDHYYAFLAKSWHAFTWFFLRNGSLLPPSPYRPVFCRTSAMVCWCVFSRLSRSECCRSCRWLRGPLGSFLVHSFEGWPFLGNVWEVW